jgi:hypothetical protein
VTGVGLNIGSLQAAFQDGDPVEPLGAATCARD